MTGCAHVPVYFSLEGRERGKEREGSGEVDGEPKDQRTALGVSHCLLHTLHEAGPFVDHCNVLWASWSAGFWVGISHLKLGTTRLQTHTDVVTFLRFLEI